MDRDGDRGRAIVRALLAAATGLGAGFVLSLGALFGLQGTVGEVGITTVIVLSLLLTQGVAFGGVALAYVAYRRLPWSFLPARAPSVRDVLWVVGGYVLALVAVSVGAAVAFALDAPAAGNRVGELGIENPSLLLALIPLSFLLVGPGEELLFRGVVQGTLREAFGPVGAVTLASAVFAMVHWVALSGGVGGRIVTVAILFLPSLVFGAAYERTRNLVVPAMIHGAYNATLFGLLYLAVSAGEVPPA